MSVATWTRTVVELAQVGGEVSTSDSASNRLTWVIYGLIALAAVIAVVTVVFWWLTRPERDAGTREVRWMGRRIQRRDPTTRARTGGATPESADPSRSAPPEDPGGDRWGT